MALHSLASVTIGVPNVTETVSYYTDFGLTLGAGGALSTSHGGEQLRIVHSPTRRLLELTVAADDADDIARIASRLRSLDLPVDVTTESLTTTEPICDIRVHVQMRPRIVQPEAPRTPYNGPGRVDRSGRADVIRRQGPVRPRKLGHAVVGTTDLDATRRFFVDGLGFRISDHIVGHGSFLRCSTDHHNILVLAAPVAYLHHTSWQVDDIDEVGRGAYDMLDGHPDRHVWGLGRHYAGSNFFWYLKDPAGNFSEYYSDMDCVPEDELWTPEDLEGARGLFRWGPPPPPSFLAPEDLAAMMTGTHSAR
ncbi:dioxygenase [Tsukamurella tyrosinosolvens]|uniref:Glyoxalase/Bleomycin resistance protein/Dioxygenase superfamily protein n=1 Tax=Tsukamurella tyrosinosolvens TaxID=57704 RepID=A0A1H5C3G8_TSUTY|nr:VOC family protein [Tsukamurella tyrosinosolvens]KXO92657.1 dioxygenase [Tsukamurella tyrosinosolvens]SED60830.1 Glyoxalase/Bleomycin resistance protein/Dioxygenase superfamily protein [Tsukamurella tyrosinosolvens]